MENELLHAELDALRSDNESLRAQVTKLESYNQQLIRIAFGPFQLGSLPRDAVAEVPAKVLAEQLGSGDGSATKPPRGKRGRLHHADRRR